MRGLSETTRDDLKQLRQGLLRLHKTLLDLERRDFERARGRIANSYEFLQLVLKDPWFDWLHRLSELIVQIDETLDTRDAEAPATEADASAFVETCEDVTNSGRDRDRVSEELFSRAATVARRGLVAFGDDEVVGKTRP